MTNMRRALTALAAGAIALPFLASPAVAGDTPIPGAREITTFCANPTAAQFADVTATGDANAVELALAVRCLRTAGVVQGLPGTNNFAPFDNVTRSSMANFIARMIDAASAREVNEGTIRELPAVPASSPFRDVPRDGTESSNNILRLAAAGIVEGNPGTATQPQGIGAGLYGPALPVARGQMGSFINRAVAYMTTGSVSGAGTTSGFTAPNAHYYDDAPQVTHERNVKGITAARIAQGVGNKQYNYVGNVSRQQMARFIARTLAALFSQEGGARILGLNNSLSANFPDGDRATATRLASPTPLAASNSTTPAQERSFTATGLASNVQYRITLVRAGSVVSGSSNDVRFATGTAATGGNGFLVNTGIAPGTATQVAVIKSVNGAAPQNNTAAGATTTTATESATAVAFAVNGVLTFTIVGASGSDIIPVIYLNGGGNQSSYNGGGGADFRLEVDVNGRPIEQFGLAGRTEFRP
jgi:hypothetical protein